MNYYIIVFCLYIVELNRASKKKKNATFIKYSWQILSDKLLLVLIWTHY